MDSARLCHMANQIARNFAAQGNEAAIKATARHIQEFWDPRMKAALVSVEGAGLDPIALEAIQALRHELA